MAEPTLQTLIVHATTFVDQTTDISVNLTGGADGLLLAVAWEDSASDRSIASFADNSGSPQSATLVRRQSSNASGVWAGVEVWKIANPAAVNSTWLAVWTGGTRPNRFVTLFAQRIDDCSSDVVHQHAGAGGNVASVGASLTTTVDDCVLWDVILAALITANPAATSSQTVLYNTQTSSGGNGNDPACGTKSAGVAGAGKTISWSFSATGEVAQVLVAIDPVAGGDVTPPTISDWETNVDGDEITGTLSEAGCTPASGTGGFTLSGTSATVSSWAISGTTITLTLSGEVEFGETVLLSYDDSTASEAIADAAENLLADITNAAVTNNTLEDFLTAGTASFVASGPDGISVEATDASGGTTPYTYQWERNEDGGSFSDLTGETALACDDDTATTPGVLYGYRLKYTDDATDTVTSNTVTAQVYSGGALTGGSSSVFQSSVIRGA